LQDRPKFRTSIATTFQQAARLDARGLRRLRKNHQSASTAEESHNKRCRIGNGDAVYRRGDHGDDATRLCNSSVPEVARGKPPATVHRRNRLQKNTPTAAKQQRSRRLFRRPETACNRKAQKAATPSPPPPPHGSGPEETVVLHTTTPHYCKQDARKGRRRAAPETASPDATYCNRTCLRPGMRACRGTRHRHRRPYSQSIVGFIRALPARQADVGTGSGAPSPVGYSLSGRAPNSGRRSTPSRATQRGVTGRPTQSHCATRTSGCFLTRRRGSQAPLRPVHPRLTDSREAATTLTGMLASNYVGPIGRARLQLLNLQMQQVRTGAYRSFTYKGRQLVQPAEECTLAKGQLLEESKRLRPSRLCHNRTIRSMERAAESSM